MVETLDSIDGGQCQLLDICIASFRIQKVAAKIIYNMLGAIIIVLH